MTAARIDVALVQPLVYSLDTWIELRKRLSERVTEGGERRVGVEGARLHLVGSAEPLFDRSLDGAASLTTAFADILRQARAFPCLVVPLDAPASSVLSSPERWPDGLSLDGAKSYLLLPRTGDPVVLHLASGQIDLGSLSGAERHLQREIRTLYRSAIESGREPFFERLEEVVTRIMGRRPPERAHDALEPSGGHFITWSSSTAPDLLTALQRVHAIEEGTAENLADLILPTVPDRPCYLRLGWSYSTVATPDVGFSYRLLFPLIAVNQAWYRYRQLRGDVIEMSTVVDGLETDRDLTAQSSFYNQVVLQVKIWEAERESFERGLQPVYRSAYDRLWDFWDTDESRSTVHDGIDQTRDFLDRKYSVKIALRENTQSKILFVIALFQLLSVFGLVSSYLYFWEETRLPESVIFDSEIMVWATLMSPIVVLGLIVWLLVTFLRRHR
jgi:hypothetical protein